jgi:ATP-dependent Clp protease ATP-binding subunit ClpA
MTTNAGAEETSRRSIGFTEQDHSTDGMAAILKKLFTPEFRNRLDAIVQFNALDARPSPAWSTSSCSSSSSSSPTRRCI